MEAKLKKLGRDDFMEMFQQAADIVMIEAQTLREDLQLELYGLFKQATVGPCNIPQPGMFKVREKMKWTAWNVVGKMSKEEAMMKYILKVHQGLQWSPRIPEPSNSPPRGPTVSPAHSNSDGGLERSTDSPDSEVDLGSCGCAGACSCATMERRSTKRSFTKSLMGNTVSTLAAQPEPEDDLASISNATESHPAFDWARDGEVQELENWAKQTDNIHIRDSMNQTPLHWAVDRGHLAAVKILLKYGANPYLTDVDGCTAVEYADTCEHKSIIDLFAAMQLNKS